MNLRGRVGGKKQRLRNRREGMKGERFERGREER